ncbi:MAG: hypothetical protein ABR548_07735 [Actinomycetota bacterium]|nr:hypothetical protein [Actinomycetota bacterium]
MDYKRTLSVAVLGLVTAACSSSTPSATTTTREAVASTAGPTPHVTCAVTDSATQIAAEGIGFDKDCLAVKAAKAFTVTFNNKQGFHNFSMYDSPETKTVLFQSPRFSGPKVETYDLQAMAPGTYFFRCDVHPGAMRGTFIVG